MSVQAKNVKVEELYKDSYVACEVVHYDHPIKGARRLFIIRQFDSKGRSRYVSLGQAELRNCIAAARKAGFTE